MESFIDNHQPVHLILQNEPSEDCCLTEDAAIHNSDDISIKRYNKYTICLTRGFRIQCVLRSMLLLVCCMSIACLCSSGDQENDALQLPLVEIIRFHIFSTILTFLTGAALLIVLSTTLIDILPINWPAFDAGSHFITGLLCVISSSLLLYLEHLYKNQYTGVTEWTRSLLVIAAAFGYCTSAMCILLTLQHVCIGDVQLLNGRTKTPEDIMMKTVIIR